MLIERINIYNNKVYSYDSEKYDFNTEMFNDEIHDNSIEPEFYRNSKTCSYCGTTFTSRNKLFYHLGFHNIDIGIRRKKKKNKYKYIYYNYRKPNIHHYFKKVKKQKKHIKIIENLFENFKL